MYHECDHCSMKCSWKWELDYALAFFVNVATLAASDENDQIGRKICPKRVSRYLIEWPATNPYWVEMNG